MSSSPNPGIREVNIEGMRLSRKYGGLQEYVHVSPTFAWVQLVVAVKPFAADVEFSTKHVVCGFVLLLVCVSNLIVSSSSYDEPMDDCTFGRRVRIWKRRMMMMDIIGVKFDFFK